MSNIVSGISLVPFLLLLTPYVFIYRWKRVNKEGDILELKTDVLCGKKFSHELAFTFRKLDVRFLK
jgi:hypothetical protein